MSRDIRPPMRASGLVLALLAAHVLGVASQSPPWSPWLLPLIMWHDVATGLSFWALDRIFRRHALLWAPYVALICWAAINVPVTRALSSPLTVPMLRAAGGPLLDSILHYVTLANVAAMATVLLIGGFAPFVLRRVPKGVARAAVVVALAVAALGPLSTGRLDGRGLHRNALTTLLSTMRPRVTASAGVTDWRASPLEERIGEDLTTLRGAAAGRNVMFIALESTGAEVLRLFGAADDPTPALTSLGSSAIVFERSYAVYPESIKGLFAVLCSRDPAFDLTAEALAGTACLSLPGLLGDAGYRTALFHSGRFAYLGMDAVVRRLRFGTLEDAGDIGGDVRSSFGVDEPAAVRRLLAWIDRGPAAQPFFVTYLPIAGHHPYASPEAGPFTDPGERGAYKNALAYGDTSLAALFEGLRERGLFDRTLFVIWGDHGEAFGQHPGNFGHSLFIYEENVHVPILVAAPGLIRSQTRIGRTASVVDLAPTVLDLLGQSPRSEHRGYSLLAPRDRLALFFTDYSLGWLGLCDGCWKFIWQVEAGRAQLFNLCADPGETHDRSGDEQARVAIYRARVLGWSGAVRAEATAPPAR